MSLGIRRLTGPSYSDSIKGSELGRKYPTAARAYRDAWERFTPFLAFPSELRRVIYTTNAIESLNYQLRKIIKNGGHFPNHQAAVKLSWLAICNIEDKRAMERKKDRCNRRIGEPGGATPQPTNSRRHHPKLEASPSQTSPRLPLKN